MPCPPRDWLPAALALAALLAEALAESRAEPVPVGHCEGLAPLLPLPLPLLHTVPLALPVLLWVPSSEREARAEAVLLGVGVGQCVAELQELGLRLPVPLAEALGEVEAHPELL